MTREEFLELAKKHDLGHVGEKLFSTSIPGLRALENALRDAFPGDTTFLGGTPKPMPTIWPVFQGKPMAFVAQVDTAALPAQVCPVPVQPGILQFFVPPETDMIYAEPAGPWCRVFFTTDKIGEDIKTTIPHEPFPKRGFDWEVFPTLFSSAPDEGDPWLPPKAEKFKLSRDQAVDSYFDLHHSLYACALAEGRVQMFGFPDTPQDITEPEVELRSQNRSVDEFRRVDKWSFLRKHPHIFQKWVLLLALYDECDCMAPACGDYYFWISRDDLAKCNFEKVWMCFQLS